MTKFRGHIVAYIGSAADPPAGSRGSPWRRLRGRSYVKLKAFQLLGVQRKKKKIWRIFEILKKKFSYVFCKLNKNSF